MPETIIQQAIDKMIQSDPDLVRRTIIELLVKEVELKEWLRELNDLLDEICLKDRGKTNEINILTKENNKLRHELELIELGEGISHK